MSEVDRTRLTYRLELLRAVPHGILESAGSTFLLLIALKYYQGGAMAKALVASGGSVGLMCAPIVVSWVSWRSWPAAQAAAGFAALGAFVFLWMALWASLIFYVIGCIVAMTAATSVIPLMTQIYQENYPEQRRGQLYSKTVMLRIAVNAAFSEWAGRFLEADLRRARLLLLLFAVAFAFAAWCLRRYPSRPLSDIGGNHPFRALRYVREDRLFRYTLICWMLMGFANLMMLPLRIEYLGHPRYRLNLDVQQIALLIGVIPNVARLIMNQLWGTLFDRMNFLALRVLLNFGFAASIVTFFLSDSFPGLVVGAIIFGVSNSGGDVAWGLWVTKLAPPERVADYMSVHVFFTGLRGVLAPIVAFHLAGVLALATIGWISAGIILLASTLLLPEIKAFRSARASPRVGDGVAE